MINTTGISKNRRILKGFLHKRILPSCRELKKNDMYFENQILSPNSEISLECH